MPIHHETCLFARFLVDWVSDPSSLRRVGALVVLGCAFQKRQAFLKTMRPSLSRKENTFLVVA